MNRDAAETIALKALAFIAGDDEGLRLLMALSGLEPGRLRESAGEPETLAGVLDFLLGDEARLKRFCDDAGLAPETPARARAALPGASRE